MQQIEHMPLSVDTVTTKRPLFQKGARYTVALIIDWHEVGIYASADTASEAASVADYMRTNVFDVVEKNDDSGKIRSGIFARRYSLPELPGLGEWVEVTTDDMAPGGFPRGTMLRVVASEYDVDIKSPENYYPVVAVPDEHFWKHEAIEQMDAIPLNTDEFIAHGHAPQGALVAA